MLLQRNRGRSDRDAAEGDCPVRSSAETKAAVPRVSVFSRFPPPCLGVRSFPAFIARIGLPSSRFRLPAFIARTGSHRVVPRTLLRASAFPRSGKPFLRQSHCAVARLFPNFACLRGGLPAAVSGALCRIAYRSISEGGGEPGNGPSPSFDRLRRSDYSSSRISRILIAAVAIGVPGPKMAAAPSR